ncbi:tail fiber protein [Qipengyuania sp. JC766]|uniref:phage tail protein n=1 Tax=Qipengyuania sp. JC766 TaxID=3232139 RepID=UPI003459ADD8
MAGLARLCAVAIVLGSIGATPARAGDGDYLGEIMTFGGTFCPRGTLEADGRLLSISENTALFSIFGTMYGGDGSRTFALPNLKRAHENDAILGKLKYCVVVTGIYPSRN